MDVTREEEQLERDGPRYTLILGPQSPPLCLQQKQFCSCTEFGRSSGSSDRHAAPIYLSRAEVLSENCACSLPMATLCMMAVSGTVRPESVYLMLAYKILAPARNELICSISFEALAAAS